MNDQVNYEDCPIGRLNLERINHASELLNKDMRNIMEKLEQQMSSLDQKMDLRFDSLDTKMEKLEQRFNSVEETLKGVDDIDSFIANKIESSKKDRVFNFFKWVVTTLLGSTAIAIFSKVVIEFIK